jgi:hypothetical protein
VVSWTESGTSQYPLRSRRRASWRFLRQTKDQFSRGGRRDILEFPGLQMIGTDMMVNDNTNGRSGLHNFGHGPQLLPGTGIHNADGIALWNLGLRNRFVQFQNHTRRVHELQIGGRCRGIHNVHRLAQFGSQRVGVRSDMTGDQK